MNFLNAQTRQNIKDIFKETLDTSIVLTKIQESSLAQNILIMEFKDYSWVKNIYLDFYKLKYYDSVYDALDKIKNLISLDDFYNFERNKKDLCEIITEAYNEIFEGKIEFICTRQHRVYPCVEYVVCLEATVKIKVEEFINKN